jgi:hypothetical protein
MAFRHISVAKIERATKDYLAQFANAVETVNENDPPVDKVDGIAVVPQLAAFCAAIRKVSRHIKFGVNGRYSRPVCTEVYAYFEGQPYAVMCVGFGGYSDKQRNGRSKYMVQARMINNQKYRPDREQYTMATAEDLERAIKNVKRYMIPYSVVECANLTYYLFKNNLEVVGSTQQEAVATARQSVIGTESLQRELFHLLDAGYEFVSPEFRNHVFKWREDVLAREAEKARAKHGYYVTARIQQDEMVCDVIEALDITSRWAIDRAAPVATYKMSELPDNIAGAVAALSMVDNNHFVRDVGMRVDSTTFWVQQ